MSVTIEIYGIQATINQMKWKCDDPSILRYLNNILDPHSYGPSDPDPDF